MFSVLAPGLSPCCVLGLSHLVRFSTRISLGVKDGSVEFQRCKNVFHTKVRRAFEKNVLGVPLCLKPFFF